MLNGGIVMKKLPWEEEPEEEPEEEEPKPWNT
jgi:hypothetical protein